MTQSNGQPPNEERGNSRSTLNPLKSQRLKQRQTQSLDSQVPSSLSTFEQPVVLRQSPVWSRAIVWSIVGIVTFGIGWACIAKIEQVVPAQGQLKPQGTVKEIQAPLNGVVQAVYVEDGQAVEPGDLLVRFDSTADLAKMKALNEQRIALLKENDLYRSLAKNPGSSAALRSTLARLQLPAPVIALTRNREELEREKRFLIAQLAGGSGRDAGRLRSARAEARARQQVSSLEVAQIRRELGKTQVALGDIRARLATERKILDRLDRLFAEGGIAELQKIDQERKVNTLEAEANQLAQEIERLRIDIAQGQVETVVTASSLENEVRDRLALIEQRIADTDSQLGQEVLQIIVKNDKLIAELNSQVSQVEQTLKYQELRAKVAGTVFDLQAHAGFVANPAEVLMSIVPDDKLIAEVFITNDDIGFVQEQMKADVRIDTFPFSEFGDIKGEVVSIGSDALPPDEVNRFYRFPAKVSLDEQVLSTKDRNIPLQSGMSVSVNIKVRENRRAISLFVELFTDQIESLKEVR